MAFVGSLATPNGLSLLGLGGPPLTPAVPPARTMASQSSGWIAHVYTNAWVPKSTFSVPGQLPTIQASLNGGYQPITLAIASLPATTVVDSGDLILISEQGGDGQPVYGGTVEDFPDVVDTAGQTQHGITVSPFVAELTDTGAVLTYSAPTEVAQMVRDALDLTAHCQFNFETIPDTGVRLPGAGSNPIQFTGHVADVLNTAILMAGSTYCWFCDERGTVWFQPMGSTADYSVRRGADYNRRQGASTAKNITNLKNHIQVIGGVPSGQSAPVTATYDNPGSQATYGKRSWDPPPTFPTIADSATLTAIAASLGAMFDRRQTQVVITLPRFAQRVTLGQLGGPTARFWEPNDDPLQETDTGSGTFSSTLSVLDVTTDGPQQVITLGDLPYTTTDDFNYLAQRITQRMATAPLTVPGPTLSGYTVMQSTSAQGGGRLSVVDATPRIRADFGNLPAYTDPNGIGSPAEYGIRAIDASGNLIFDSSGVAGVMQFIDSAGFSTSFGGSGIFATTGGFTLARQTNVLVFTVHSVTPPPAAPSATAITYHIFDGVASPHGFSNCSWTGSIPNVTNGTLVDLWTFGPGSHNISVNAASVFGGTFQVTGTTLVFQLGA